MSNVKTEDFLSLAVAFQSLAHCIYEKPKEEFPHIWEMADEYRQKYRKELDKYRQEAKARQRKVA
jgi:hypothetical protein